MKCHHQALVVPILFMFLLGTLPLSSALIEVTVNLKYDRNGNLIQDANYYYEYNSYNLLSRIRDHDASGRILAEYWYGGNRERLIKTVYHEDGSNTTTYYIDENFVREIGPDGTVRDTVYYYDDRGTLLARKDHDGRKYFYHPDALGSTALVTDEAGNVVEEVEYLPFGEVIEGGNDRYLFTGKEKDKETGLSYYGARFYDPNQARFIQPDSIQPNVYDPQALNKYAYARNNPVKYTDPSGHFFLAIGGFMLLNFLIADVITPALTTELPITIALAQQNMQEHGTWKGLGVTATEITGGEVGGRIVGRGLKYGGERVSSIFKSSNKAIPSIERGTEKSIANPPRGLDSGVNEFSIKDLYGTHPLKDKSSIMETRTYEEGLRDISEPIEVWNLHNKMIVMNGERRTARSALVYGKDTVSGKTTHQVPPWLEFTPYEQVVYDKAKYQMQYVVEGLEKK